MARNEPPREKVECPHCGGMFAKRASYASHVEACGQFPPAGEFVKLWHIHRDTGVMAKLCDVTKYEVSRHLYRLRRYTSYNVPNAITKRQDVFDLPDICARCGVHNQGKLCGDCEERENGRDPYLEIARNRIMGAV